MSCAISRLCCCEHSPDRLTVPLSSRTLLSKYDAISGQSPEMRYDGALCPISGVCATGLLPQVVCAVLTHAGRQSLLGWSVAGIRPTKRELTRLRTNAVPIAETAAMTSQIAGLFLRAATACVFVYATLQWNLLRGLRKKVRTAGQSS